jgi:hypothetical protein
MSGPQKKLWTSLTRSGYINQILKPLLRLIVNTAIGRDVIEALADYKLPVLKTAICQRVAFAESAEQGSNCCQDRTPRTRGAGDQGINRRRGAMISQAESTSPWRKDLSASFLSLPTLPCVTSNNDRTFQTPSQPGFFPGGSPTPSCSLTRAFRLLPDGKRKTLSCTNLLASHKSAVWGPFQFLLAQ